MPVGYNNSRNFLAAQFDAATELKDAGAVSANGGATVAGVARVVNLGTGFMQAVCVFDVDVVKTSVGDEAYEAVLQASSVADFSSNVVNLIAFRAGSATASGESAARLTGRQQKPFINSPDGITPYPFVRLFFKLAGTAPSINCRAFITKSNLG